MADDVFVQLGNPGLDLAGTTQEMLGSALWWSLERILRLSLLPCKNIDQRWKVGIAPNSNQHVGHQPSVEESGSVGRRRRSCPHLTSVCLHPLTNPVPVGNRWPVDDRQPDTYQRPVVDDDTVALAGPSGGVTAVLSQRQRVRYAGEPVGRSLECCESTRGSSAALRVRRTRPARSTSCALPPGRLPPRRGTMRLSR